VGTVTFLFSDIEGSSELVRSIGDDAFAAVRGDHRLLLREAFAAHDGHEIDTGFEVAASIAIDPGRRSGDPDRTAAPTTLRRLGLLASKLEPGQVLVSQATAALVAGDPVASQLRELGERSLSEDEEPERVYELCEAQA